MTSLDQFPDVVLLNILEKLDILDVLSLRKTCRSLYNFIDDVCPNKNLQVIKITTFSNAIKLEFVLPDSQRITVEYDDFHGTSCLVRWTKIPGNPKIKKETILKNADFMGVASRDLEILLKHQKTKLTYLKISFQSEIDAESLDFFPRILESRPRPLQIENLDLEVTQQSQLLQILPFIDPDAVSYLRIERYGSRGVVLEIDDVARLENWKTLRNSIHIGWNNGNIRDFLNFSYVYVKFPIVTVEDLVFLKETFLHSSRMNCVYLQVVTPVDLPELLEAFGPSNDDINYMGGYRKRWFFKCYSNPDDILSIGFNPRCLHFQREN
ncbi:hypothetical protein CRE_23421 [Caenorhabditis remanei]|uniref:F-box domain-containing protein n=1 Tax=Caenorhabditis remanei TaxID=31234 RepID=E3MGP9_CAERE|nr:hypothetical protein CRE_23421 [Caenorhabditis remanei]